MHAQQNPDFVSQDIGGETILYSKNDEAIHVLNLTAKAIWDLCDGQHSVNEMEQMLRDTFSIRDDQDVSADVQRVLAVFQTKGLIQPVAQV